MVHASNLRDIDKPPFRIRQEEEPLTLSMIKDYFESTNEEEYGLPMRVSFSQIKSGGLFNSRVEDCLTIVNTEHEKDYFQYYITLRSQGKIAIVEMKIFGVSKLIMKKNEQMEREQNGGLGGMLRNMISGVDEAQLAAEYQYYGMVEQMYEDMVSFD